MTNSLNSPERTGSARSEEELDAIEAALDEVDKAFANLDRLAPDLGRSPASQAPLESKQKSPFVRPPTHLMDPQLLDPRIKANRENAKLSTGPSTPAGKEVSKLNATRHGLTGRQVLLPSEDAEAYTAHMERFRRDLRPATERELELTQMLADTQWRLNRIPTLESSIFAVGRMRYAGMHKDFDPAIRDQVIDFYTLEQHARQLNNLSIQESRLRRNYAKDLAELETLQAERRKQETAAQAQNEQSQSTTVKTAAASAGSTADGFVFSDRSLNLESPAPTNIPAADQSAFNGHASDSVVAKSKS